MVVENIFKIPASWVYEFVAMHYASFFILGIICQLIIQTHIIGSVWDKLCNMHCQLMTSKMY